MKRMAALNGTSNAHQNPPSPETKADRRRKTLLEALGRRVRAHRMERGLSQQALARHAGLSLRFVAQLEAGQGNISVAKLDEVARALAVPLADLLRAPEPPPPRAAVRTLADTVSRGTPDVLRSEVMAWLEHSTTTEMQAVRHMLQELRERPSAEQPLQVIALLGLRGAGKSTVGALLAKALGVDFLELDELIQEETGLALSELFELHGERYYRQAERQALRRLVERGHPVVVAVSGGAVTDRETLSLLRTCTLSVWLKATPEQHMTRVVSQGDRRPMADRPDAMTELKALLAARTPYYEQARVVVDTSTATPQACVCRLVGDLEHIRDGAV